LLVVKKISTILNGKVILSDVSCELKRGEILLIVGPNGSGKSTLLKVIMGLIKPISGDIFVDNVKITHLKPSERFKLGIVLAPEKMRIAANLTVEENLAIGGNLDAKVFEFFPELKPLIKRRAGELSSGERQMVVLGRALLSKPRYLLMDEPFNGLYKVVRIRVLNLIRELSKDAGVAVVTHDEIREVLPIADKVCVLIGGKVAYFGDVRGGEEVMKKYMFI
jgi:branched-chain amino acid transport system ATP-binding protein